MAAESDQESILLLRDLVASLSGSSYSEAMPKDASSAAICAISLLCGGLSLSALAADPDFDRQIAPILASRCLDCHNGAEKKGGLDLNQVKTAEAGGDSGKVLSPGKLSESLLWERIDKSEMPPKKPLPENERGAIQAWIAAGAKWGTSPIDPYKYTTSVRAGYDWWSLQPLVAPALPPISDSNWVKSPIDAFVLAKLQARGLAPSPPADRRTLIRRLYFDLIGLPPTPEEVEAFTKDKSPEAYARRVQKLLDSPHYGERWARHWLDVAHFGESDGFEYDRMRPNAWRYRDWVIEGLNRDLPYDEFARLQIAGDVLRPNDPAAITATGFLVGGAHDSLLPKGDVMRTIMRQDELEDIVAIVGQTFLGVTVNCARCHDHKFDPIKQTDYYRLASALAGVRRGERSLPPQGASAELANRRDELRKQLTAIEEPVRKAILAERERAANKKPAPPKPFAHWEFDSDLKDSAGLLHGEAKETARLEKGELLLDGKNGHVATAPLPADIKEKTLEAWVRLTNLEQKGGGVISIQTLDGTYFDSLVFAEKEPGQWLAGSNFFARTQSFDGPKEEQAKDRPVHLAITYASDGTITGYRDGLPYGKPYKSSGPLVFQAKNSQIVFGLRHGPSGGNKHLAGAIERANFYDRALSPEEVAASAGVASRHIGEEELAGRLKPPQRYLRNKLLAEIVDASQKLSAASDPKVFACTPQQPAEPTHLLLRGNPLAKGEPIAPAGLSALAGSGSEFGLAPDAPEADRRKRMAQWIASEQNPLFARTIVNRVWQYHFGRGLVDTTSDIGFSGGTPTHPELLDWLASELIRQKWSLKELHRTIVLSATWQQASLPRKEGLAVDVDNRLLWRYSPRRMEAEAIRDAMLTITGQLNPAVGGPSYKDFRPYEHKGGQFYEPQDFVGPEFNRRSIYRMWARGGKNPLLDTFDCPDPSTATPKRGATTTPLQALSLLNNSFTLRMADDLAVRVRREAGEDKSKQVARALELANGRPANSAEVAASLPLVEKHGLAPFCRVLLNTNGFLYVN
jgi:Protein of unknown function (DUF1553)/Protein of unknown function (DUF1549)/Concanavalin A-like lectin/glucanases superfamily/Planctomycete cytochrome C